MQINVQYNKLPDLLLLKYDLCLKREMERIKQFRDNSIKPVMKIKDGTDTIKIAFSRISEPVKNKVEANMAEKTKPRNITRIGTKTIPKKLVEKKSCKRINNRSIIILVCTDDELYPAKKKLQAITPKNIPKK